MNVIEEIHNSVDSAVDRLKQISTNYSNHKVELLDVNEKAEKLKNLGFKNIPIVTEYENNNNINIKNANQISTLHNKAEGINYDLARYSKIYPFHKFIYYSQLVAICEKYKLVLGPVDCYKNDIPEKNMDEIIKFDYDKSLPYRLHINQTRFLFNQTYDYYSRTSGTPLYICAPKRDFINDISQIGIEVIKNNKNNVISLKDFIRNAMAPKDPIILLPVSSAVKGQIGFIVLSKWGNEANDPGLTVSINN